MISIDIPEKENMVTIPVNRFVELVEKSAKLDIFLNMINSDSVYSKDDLLMVLGQKKIPCTDQSKQGIEKNFLDEV